MASRYEITLERGSDGTYLAWVNDLPGCAVRGRSREDVLERLPQAIADFLDWAGAEDAGVPAIKVVDEVDTLVETEEDTEVLVSADRAALTEESWTETQRLLAQSRRELLAFLDTLTDELDRTREGSSRTVREEVEHVAFVELMYAAWTFDLGSRDGLRQFLQWTRSIAEDRMRTLARAGAADVTAAKWGGAPRPEPWTARKAARRLLWHELLHLRAIERG